MHKSNHIKNIDIKSFSNWEIVFSPGTFYPGKKNLKKGYTPTFKYQFKLNYDFYHDFKLLKKLFFLLFVSLKRYEGQ